ncbi:uncharacterized protein LOC112171316 [Rosa chinensis]|uniref:uncharacterized protein LOC112171316 n=1 Tax=Rosa chinensis TaxID=74649 RepID=UPI000D0948FE|nr:uncharacterized protein LOC112171316 [Rosa chinensis]
MNSNWFSQWNERQHEDEQDDEEHEEYDAQRRRNTTQLMAEAVSWLATNPLHQQLQWGGYVSGLATRHRSREVRLIVCIGSGKIVQWDDKNDIIVLGRSPLFDAVTAGEAPQFNYHVNETPYEFGYYLADGIYPKWVTLVQSIKHPENDAEVYFSIKQEAYRKDVERAFGILQARFAIIRQLARGWERESLSIIMLACIILHNMIVEDERDDYYNGESDDDDPNPNRSRRARARIYDGPNLPRNLRTGHITMTEYMSRYRRIRSHVGNNNLRNNLIQHVWSNRRC